MVWGGVILALIAEAGPGWLRGNHTFRVGFTPRTTPGRPGDGMERILQGIVVSSFPRRHNKILMVAQGNRWNKPEQGKVVAGINPFQWGRNRERVGEGRAGAGAAGGADEDGFWGVKHLPG